MPMLSIDPFKRLGVLPTDDITAIRKAYLRAAKGAGPEELKSLQQECGFITEPRGLFYARLATPIGGKSYKELQDSLPSRPRYLGPGKWKQALRRIINEESRSPK